jgi:plasmid stability protein
VGSLVIRNLDDDVKSRLRVRAAEHGHSMEAEARDILAAALRNERPARGLGTYLRSFVGDDGFDLEIPPREGESRGVDFSGPEFGPADDE